MASFTQDTKIGLSLVVAGTIVALIFPLVAVVGYVLVVYGVLNYFFPGPRFRKAATLVEQGQSEVRDHSAKSAQTPIPWYLAPFTWLSATAVIVIFVAWSL